MTWSISSCFITLVVLFLWRVEDIAEACSCSPAHPQQAFCNADVAPSGAKSLNSVSPANPVQISFLNVIPVIRAKVVGKKVVEAGNDVYGNTIKRIKYDIKQIKMFKGPDRDIDAIFTAPSSAVCGVTLETNGNKEYLFTGKLETDGTMHVTLCDFIESWEAMSATQKKSLTQRYESGCKCKIIRCTSIPCTISAPEECLWTDWVMEKSHSGPQAQHFACINRSDGSCAWYRGIAPPKKEFLDIEDP